MPFKLDLRTFGGLSLMSGAIVGKTIVIVGPDGALVSANGNYVVGANGNYIVPTV